MEVTRYLCLLFTMGLLGSVRPDVNCNSESELLAAQGKCFRDQGLEISQPYIYTPETGRKLVPYLDLVVKRIPESVCKKPDNFSRALACVGDINQQCGLSSISPTRTLPQIVDKLCIKDTNVNLACATAYFNDALQCDAKKGSEIGSSSSSLTSELFCKVYKAQNDCQRSLYHYCGCATVRAYETIYLDIFYQAVCPQSLSSISRVLCDFNNTNIFLNNSERPSAGIFLLNLPLLVSAVLFFFLYVS